MKRNKIVNVSVAVAAALCLSAAVRGEEAKKVNVIYFGNSFCENSLPAFQPMLAKSAGKEMTVAMSGGAGWQTWMVGHRMISEPEGKFKPVLEGDWNTVVIQHFPKPIMRTPLILASIRRGLPHRPIKK